MPGWMNQSGIKTAERNVNNLRYADDTMLRTKKPKGTKEPLDAGEREREKNLA